MIPLHVVALPNLLFWLYGARVCTGRCGCVDVLGRYPFTDERHREQERGHRVPVLVRARAHGILLY